MLRLTRGHGSGPTSSPGSCSPRSSCRRAWPTPSWPGCPPVTGLYTTIACLVGYALMGPSRVLVLGPDSSVSPLIFAAIAPLVVAGDDPATAIALAGMLALLVGLIEIGLGRRQARLRRRPAVEGGPGRLHERARPSRSSSGSCPSCAASRPTPTASSTRCATFVDGLRPDATPPRSPSASATLAVLLVLPAHHAQGSRRCSSRSSARPSSPPCSTSDSVTTVGTLPEGLPEADAAVDRRRATSCRCSSPRSGITLVSLTDTIATSTSFAARRGDEVDPNQEMIGIGAGEHRRRLLPGLRRVDERLAHRGRRAVGREEPAHRPRRRRARRRCCCCSSTRCSPTCRRRRSPRW